MDDQAATNSDRSLQLITQRYGEITFDLSLNGYREEIVNMRVPHPQGMSPAQFVDLFAAASIAKLGERIYEPGKRDSDSKDLRNLEIEFTAEEQEQFSRGFLDYNDYLLSKYKISKDAAVNAVKTLHSIWVFKRKEESAFVRQLIGPDIGSGLFAAGMNHTFARDRSLTDQLVRLSPGLGVHQALIDQTVRLSGLSAGLGKQQHLINQIVGLGTGLGKQQHLINQIVGLGTDLGKQQHLIDQLASLSRGLGKQQYLNPLSRDLETWRAIERSSSALFPAKAVHSMFEAVTGALVGRMAEKRLVFDEAFKSHLLGPSHAFTSFFEETSRMARASSATLHPIFDAVLGFSAVHFGASSLFLNRLFDEIEQEAFEDISLPERTLDLFPLHREEALKRAEHELEASPESLIARLELTQLATLVREVLTLVVDCNEASRISRGVFIFPPTNRILRAAVELPQMVPYSRRTLGDVIDDLFFILYEGAGDDKLRFLKEAGGVFDANEAPVEYIWHLKSLRNKWLRHDPEHGGERKVQKSFTEVGQTFRALGLASLPTSREHFIALYLRLLVGLREFLQELLGRLEIHDPE